MEQLHVKSGDTVVVLSGDSKKMKKGDELVPRIGKVIATSPEEGKVIVAGANIVSKHTKARKQGENSQIVKTEGAIYACKVQLVCTNSGCEKYNKPIRVKKSISYVERDGKQKRVVKRLCPKCGAEI